MADILTIISNQTSQQTDPYGQLASLSAWSDTIAENRAREQGITLTAQHRIILKQLRRYYAHQLEWNHPREIQKVMEQACAFATETDNPRKALFELFPGGPVRQGCELAGLPVPENSTNPSFGSVL